MSASEKDNKRAFRRRFILNTMVILAVTALVLATSVFAAGSSLVSSKTFPDGTTVSGIDLSGLTHEEGREALERGYGQKLDAICIKLDYGGEIIALNASDLGLNYDIDTTLAAISYADGGSALAKYMNAVLEPRQAGDTAACLVYDRAFIAAALEKALSPYDIAPVNAKMVFDESGEGFSYEPEVLGRRAQVKVVTEVVIDLIELENPAPLIVACDAIMPEITQADLMENTSLIGETQVPLPDNADTATNLRTACGELNGAVIMPGEIFSLCDRVGKPQNDADDGINRLAGALYNAALLTNMEIVSRAAHTCVPDYFPAGLDAVIDWLTNDLKIKNSSDLPIYIAAAANGKTLTIRLYGVPLFEGLSIKVATDRIREVEPSEPGGEPGYEVAVYRNYYLNDSMKSSELVSRDVYEARPASAPSGAVKDGK